MSKKGLKSLFKGTHFIPSNSYIKRIKKDVRQYISFMSVNKYRIYVEEIINHLDNFFKYLKQNSVIKIDEFIANNYLNSLEYSVQDLDKVRNAITIYFKSKGIEIDLSRYRLLMDNTAIESKIKKTQEQIINIEREIKAIENEINGIEEKIVDLTKVFINNHSSKIVDSLKELTERKEKLQDEKLNLQNAKDVFRKYKHTLHQDQTNIFKILN